MISFAGLGAKGHGVGSDAEESEVVRTSGQEVDCVSLSVALSVALRVALSEYGMNME